MRTVDGAGPMRGDIATRRIVEAMALAPRPWQEMGALEQQWWVDYAVKRERALRKVPPVPEPGEQGTLL